MNRIVHSWCALFLCSTLPVFAGVSPQSIDGPNGYGFVLDTYYADAGASNATIAVQWAAGNRDYCCGNVEFATSAATAIAGKDYDDVSGTLYFSDPYWRTFNVPLHASPSPVDKTIQLTLKQSDPNSYFLPCSTAVLVIRASPPILSFTRTNNTLRLFWPNAYTNYIVETIAVSETNSAQWSAALPIPYETNRQFTVEIPLDGQSRFFRLRKQ